MKVFGFVRKYSSIFSALSDLGTFIVAVLAVIIFFSRDLQLEYLRLLNEKINLVSDEAKLRTAVGLLDYKRGRVEDDLKDHEQKLAVLQNQLTLTEKQSRILQAQTEGYARSATALTAKNVALMTRYASTEKSANALADRLLPMMLVTYLSRLHPTTDEAWDSSNYEFIYDPDDPGFRFSSKGDFVTFLFTLEDAEDLAKPPIPPTSSLCKLDEKYAVVGMMQTWHRDESGLTIKLLDVTLDFPFKYLCNVLHKTIEFRSVDAPYHVIRDVGYRTLMKKNRGFIISFFPENFDGVKFEEIRARGFWAPMFGLLYQKELRQLDTSDFEEKLGALGQGSAVSFSFGNTVRDLVANVPAELKQAGFAEYADKARVFVNEWQEYLKSASIHSRRERRAVMNDGHYNILLSRIRAEDIDSDAFYNEMNEVRFYNAELNCLAMKFAVQSEYVSGAILPEYERCEETERSIDAGIAIRQDIDHEHTR